MPEWTIDTTAGELLRREHGREDGARITEGWPDLDLGTAYRIQDALLDRKTGAGQTVVGVKLGLTSRAKQRRMGVDVPLTGWLTDAMTLAPGEPVAVGQFIHPRVEPEIAFVMGARLSGPGVTAERAMSAVRSVHAGFEVIDSRYRDFDFALPDVVADNASACRFAVSGSAVPPDGLDLAEESCRLSVDGETVDTATGAAVLGHPANALALAANGLAERGLAIEPGWIILTGGLTDAVPLHPGSTVSVAFDSLGALSLTGTR
ncbi:2-oxo-3-hexenedioate decarboxylase [Actinomadura coerulea]|uniref:2-oxo-3-hexenedioate decarboxylase n=1 Tax=Actinomadura coerulea TaxID=46159 RepID=A0A7X0G2E8_9ACTN|nr:fumarylacetoacetate hydrolase family protein [Actinomadura coerulea]MBB6398173.1 2-oxo-3-hexenedioate decarboxylase [Actinomadura coerulea]GGQ35845.1 4-oxalocrotonate decarboxylase [Actinomadura coerulea]